MRGESEAIRLVAAVVVVPCVVVVIFVVVVVLVYVISAGALHSILFKICDHSCIKCTTIFCSTAAVAVVEESAAKIVFPTCTHAHTHAKIYLHTAAALAYTHTTIRTRTYINMMNGM